MVENQTMDSLDLDATETNAALESNRLEPKLRQLLFSLDVDMWRLLAVCPGRSTPPRAAVREAPA
jgi:hypothetical protein